MITYFLGLLDALLLIAVATAVIILEKREYREAKFFIRALLAGIAMTALCLALHRLHDMEEGRYGTLVLRVAFDAVMTGYFWMRILVTNAFPAQRMNGDFRRHMSSLRS